MGTTTTPNLGLIKPDLNEPIPNWARAVGLDNGQNAANCNTIDGVFDTTVAGFGVWNPSWTADTTNPILGSGGVVQGRYLRLWPKFVFVYVRIFTGTTGFNAGAGTYRLDLPFTLSTTLKSAFVDQIPLGKAILRDNSSVAVSEAPVVCFEPSSDTLFIRTEAGSSSWAPNTPFTLGQSDRMSCYFSYLTDEAL